MTLDLTPLSEQAADPHGLTNFDSPRFDLESVYGGGPAGNPQFYEPDGSGRLRVTRNANGVDDLPRTADGVALIGDGRNDENLIVSTGVASSFAQAQRLTRWNFQWIIVHDYLAHVAGADVVARFLTGTTVKREFYKPKNPNRPMTPIEYSVAAFRFGHSMVRAGMLTPSRIIDARLPLPLFNLPPTVVDDPVVSLAQRNLLRGKRLGLPAGQDVARQMGVTPLTNTELGLPDPGRRLGAVGGRLVTETILGILDADKDSYLHPNPAAFRPAAPIAPTAGRFLTGDLIAFATGS